MLAKRAHSDDGLTLIELLVAMVIMGVAVVVVLSALVTMTVASENHRGYSATEVATHNFVQAVQRKISFKTTLVSPITATQNAPFNITVQDDASLLATTTGGFYIVVDNETMHASSVSGKTIRIDARQEDFGDNSPTSAAAHTAGAPVLPVFRCPSITDLTPIASEYALPAGVTNAQITGVDYWVPGTNPASFTNATTCSTQYDQYCFFGDHQAPDIRWDCDPGIERLSVVVTVNDPRLGNLGPNPPTSTIVRRWSS